MWLSVKEVLPFCRSLCWGQCYRVRHGAAGRGRPWRRPRCPARRGQCPGHRPACPARSRPRSRGPCQPSRDASCRPSRCSAPRGRDAARRRTTPSRPIRPWRARRRTGCRPRPARRRIVLLRISFGCTSLTQTIADLFDGPADGRDQAADDGRTKRIHSLMMSRTKSTPTAHSTRPMPSVASAEAGVAHRRKERRRARRRRSRPLRAGQRRRPQHR